MYAQIKNGKCEKKKLMISKKIIFHRQVEGSTRQQYRKMGHQDNFKSVYFFLSKRFHVHKNTYKQKSATTKTTIYMCT